MIQELSDWTRASFGIIILGLVVSLVLIFVVRMFTFFGRANADLKDRRR